MREVRVPATVSQRIREFGLSRPVLVSLLTHFHANLSNDYPASRRNRVRNDDRCYRYRIVIADGDARHLFLLAVDDSTSPDHLIPADIVHSVR